MPLMLPPAEALVIQHSPVARRLRETHPALKVLILTG